MITDVQLLGMAPELQDQWVAINLAGVERVLAIEVEEALKVARQIGAPNAEGIQPDQDIYLVPILLPQTEEERRTLVIQKDCPPYTQHIKLAWDLAMVERAQGRVITLVAWPDDQYSAGVALDITRDEELIAISDHPARSLCLAVGYAQGKVRCSKGQQQQKRKRPPDDYDEEGEGWSPDQG